MKTEYYNVVNVVLKKLIAVIQIKSKTNETSSPAGRNKLHVFLKESMYRGYDFFFPPNDYYDFWKGRWEQ